MNWIVRFLMKFTRPYSHLRHADGSLYMERFTIWFKDGWIWIRLHHIVTPDIDVELHNHPWHFVSIMLQGGYYEKLAHSDKPEFMEIWNGKFAEILNCTQTWRNPGSIALRRLKQRHKILEVRANTWTLVITGGKKQSWGFFTPKGFVNHHDFESVHQADPHQYF